MAKIEQSRKDFDGLPQKEREQRANAAAGKYPSDFLHLFTYANDMEWVQPCPSCGAGGYCAGDLVNEELTEDNYGYSLWETVEREYSADEFACPVCQLKLVGRAEVETAGIPVLHTEMEEREVEYEPEYGNC
jgi:hypothetical protein